MYKIDVCIRGVAPLLHHKFGKTALDSSQDRTKKRIAKPDYSKEWMDTMYHDNGHVVQPATHIEGSMVKGAARHGIPGQGKRTYKDPIRAYCYVIPEMIPLLWNGEPIPTPDETLLDNPLEPLSVSIMRVTVSRAAVARSRLLIDAGWELQFQIEVHNDDLQLDEIYQCLETGGQSIGIGDYRPRYGRYEIIEMEKAR